MATADELVFTLRTKRIFIIEDQPANFAVVKHLLEMQGATVQFSRWGTDALHRMSDFAPIDLVLLDLMFPRNVSGYDLFDEIRQHPDFATVPIVAVSASDPTDTIPKVRAKGFNGFIAKPIDYEQFPKQVERVLKHQEVWITR
ncbi:MAG: response regulator [Armatimonadetes bacterium]|nr:response regulator [Anaerolineae bacterium]